MQATQATQQKQAFHVRVFDLKEHEFSIGDLSLDDWLTEERGDGYVLTSMVALPGNDTHLRVATEYQPEKAGKHPGIAPAAAAATAGEITGRPPEGRPAEEHRTAGGRCAW